MTVAAASASAALRASTVTASAMPREKERPRQPLVAMPQRYRAVGEGASIRIKPSGRARASDGTTPMSSGWPGVTSMAMSPPLLT